MLLTKEKNVMRVARGVVRSRNVITTSLARKIEMKTWKGGDNFLS